MKWLQAGVLGGALVLTSCGGGGDGGSAGPGPGPQPDNQPPTVALTAPANYADALSGTLTLAATASDNVGVAAVEFQLDGAALSEASSAPYRASLETGSYVAGQHLLRARARDAAGNRSPWATALVRFGGSADVDRGFAKNEAWLSGLSNATAMAQAPDGRLFVAQQDGALRVVKNGQLLATPFATFSVNSAGERGLLGVVLHPDFTANGWVYVYYTTDAAGTHNRISRLKANGDVSAGEEATANLPINLPALSSASNHNGGALHFGNDGKLYVGVGDNANGAQSPNLGSVFGKLLRFNDDGSIPADNPFYGSQTGLARAVWAYGLRNPYTFAFQPGSGRLHINDVGQNTWEEINVGLAGANYGWPSSEGPDGIMAGMTAPLFAYKHSAASPAGSGPGGFLTGFAIAGGSFYPTTGPYPASYRGNYYFADYVSSYVARLDLANDNAVYSFARLSGNPVDMLVGQDGALYVLTRSAITRIAAQ